MNISFQSTDPQSWKADAIIVFCCEGEKPANIYKKLDRACPWLAIAPALQDFHARLDETMFLYGHPDLPLPRVLLIGLGKKDDVRIQTLRQASALAARKCKQAGIAKVLLAPEFLDDFPGGSTALAEECCYGFYLGIYKFTALKTRKNPEDEFEPHLVLSADPHAEALKKAVEKGINAAKAVCFARDLDNMPGNMLYPEILALKADALAQEYNLHCEIYDESGLRKLGAGCLLAVGQGSAHPPRLIVLEYSPENCDHKDPMILIGKGITFDSGGLCLKPAANMGEMKCDMSGAAAVLAVICAAAQEKLDRYMVAILACAENMPDGGAYRPGDILTALNGETVEVVNTDAEGRLVLADALAYARQNWHAEALIDIATLTGACAVALGKNLGGLFANNEKLAAQLLTQAESCGDNLWRMPLWKPYKKALKSEIADIRHTAAREGGAITAALFLENFVADDSKWAHLDIAGVDWNGEDTPLCPVGPTAFGVRLLLEFARSGLL